MNNLINAVSGIILSIWISAIAILSVQNASVVSLKFLTFQSIEIPIGVVLGLSASLGVMVGAIAPIFFKK
ncbi:MAG TPA: DUF1049 domain-containing protein [Allocoleopsis sp.]